MNNLPVMLAHFGRGGGAIGALIVVGFIVLVFALALSERAKSSSKD